MRLLRSGIGPWTILAMLTITVMAVSLVVQADWRAVCEPEVVQLVDSQVDNEHVIIIELDPSEAPDRDALLRSYPYISLTERLSPEMSAFRNSVAEWGLLVNGWDFRRADQTVWERSECYLAFAHAVVLRCRVSDIPYIADLPFVHGLYDGELPIDVMEGVADVGAATHTEEGDSLGAWFGETVSSASLGRYISELGWIPVSTESLLSCVDDFRLVPTLSNALSSQPQEDCRLVGVATLGEAQLGDLLSAFATWPQSLAVEDVGGLSAVLTRAEFLQCVDTALQVGATNITLGSIDAGDDALPLALFWRSGVASGMASIAPVAVETSPEYYVAAAEAPQNLTATQGAHADRVVVSWTPVAGAHSYEVLRTSNGEAAFEPISVASGSGYVDSDVETCVSYEYCVRVFSESQLGSASTEALGYIGAVPEVVVSVDASDGIVPGGVLIRWSAAAGATEYVVFRSELVNTPRQRSSKVYAVYVGPETEFLDQDLVPGLVYSYTVLPGNGCGRSAVGNGQDVGYAGFATAPLDPVHPPVFLSATLVSPRDHVELSWSSVIGATEYRIYRAAAYGGPYEVVGSTSALEWRDEDTDYCQDYWYRVQAVVGGETSGLSVVAHGVCGGKPAKPGTIRVSEGIYPETIRLDWTEADEAQFYWILRGTSSDGPFTKIGQTTELYYVDGGLVPGQVFWYRLEARNDCGGSGWTGVYRGSTSE
jgi:fibronectin type 3 domain-containing protein